MTLPAQSSSARFPRADFSSGVGANVAVTIGNFDGVHLGHAELIKAARQAVSNEGQPGRVIVLAFDPHPATVLRPEASPSPLSTIEQRRSWILEAGADELIVLQPEPGILNLSPGDFIAEVARAYQPRFIVEGSDFCFGKNRAGSVQTLEQLGLRFGFETIVVKSITAGLSDQSLVAVSSSVIRWLIVRGRVRDASLLLGRPYELIGEVVQGDKRGRAIGFPTANLRTSTLLPGDGVYAGIAHAPDGQRFAAAISVGSKPAFGGTQRLCEAHLIDCAAKVDHYGWQLWLEFHHWLRDQLFYSSIEPLIEQIRRDVQRARELVQKDAQRYEAFTPLRKAAGSQISVQA